jgi:hypothetical protein
MLFVGASVSLADCGGAGSPTAPSGPSISVGDPAGATSITCSANVVTPGSASSVLVQVTQPGGLMFGNFRATPAEKAATIRRWVVDFNAAQ